MKTFCLNCGEEFTVTKIYHDNMGAFTVCPFCEGSFDIDFEEEKAHHNSPFIDDSAKMLDFLYLSKEDFLQSYSYLTEDEYNATVDAVLKLLYGGEQNAL